MAEEKVCNTPPLATPPCDPWPRGYSAIWSFTHVPDMQPHLGVKDREEPVVFFEFLMQGRTKALQEGEEDMG